MTAAEARLRVLRLLASAHDPAAAPEAVFADYGEWLCTGIESMRALVHAFYDPDFSFGRAIREAPETRDRITDCLVGDIFSDFSDLITTLKRFAAIPEPLAHGRSPKEEPPCA